MLCKVLCISNDFDCGASNKRDMTALTSRVDRLSLNSYSVSQLQSPSRYTGSWIGLLMLADIVMMVLAAYVAGATVDRQWGLHEAELRFFHSSVVFVGIWLIIFCSLGLYRRSFALTSKDEFYFTTVALILGVIPQFILFSLMPQLSASRSVLLLAIAFATVFVGCTRSVLRGLHLRVSGLEAGKILLVGRQAVVDKLSRELEQTSRAEVVSISTERDLDSGVDCSSSYVRRARELGCDRLVIADVPISRDIYRLLSLTRRHDIKLYWPLATGGASASDQQQDAGASWTIAALPEICTPHAKLLKRIVDFTTSLLGIIVLSPVLCVVAVLIVLDSGPPVLYRQPRVGRYGKIFEILKFRTMRTDADEAWAKPGDERITRLGAFLRRTSLDELPQLFNVLKGEMSLVGPRPEMASFEELFAKTVPYYAERRLALPGITGWAQIHLKRNLTPEDAPDVLSHDLFYVEHWSLFLDFGILFKTAAEFLFHRAV